MKYGMLTFVRDAEPSKFSTATKKNRCALWRCDCGKEKVIPVTYVRNGQSRSCGCAAQKAMRSAITRQYVSYLIDQKNKGVA